MRTEVGALVRDNCTSPGDRTVSQTRAIAVDGGGEQWPDAGCIFKVEPTGFSERLHLGCDRKRNG